MKIKYSTILSIFTLSFLYIPISILVVFSFNKSSLLTVWGGWSTRWYGALLEDSEVISALLTSLKVASISASIAVIIGVCSGLLLARFNNFKGVSLFSLFLSIPMMLPEVIIGFSLLALYIMIKKITGWPKQFNEYTVMASHATIGISYVALLIKIKLSEIDKSLEEAALDLGAPPFYVFKKITLPLLMPAIITGWFLTFTLSLDDLVIASFTSGPGATTLPMLIYSRVRLGVSPEINALATLLIGGVILFVAITYILLINKEKILQKKNVE